MSSISTSTATFQPSRAGLSPRAMYFPPPPAYASQQQDANTKKSVPFTFNFKAQSQGRPSTDSSSTNSVTLQKPPRPILKRSVSSTKRTRQWILLSLLLFSFTILILSVIFAYCAALPHSDNIADAQASELAAAEGFDGPVTTTVSLQVVAASTSVPAYTSVSKAAVITGPAQPQSDSYPTRRLKPRLLSARDTPTIAKPVQEMTQDEIDAALARDAQNQARFSTTQAQVALTFYTATLPLLTILHTAVELLISLVRPETSQNTKLGDLVLLRNRGANGATATANAVANSVIRRRRVGALLSFSVSAMLLLGWSVMQLFTLNCEIVTFGPGGEGVCPVQIRGHRMGGISELSVVKVGLGFAVVLGYLGYCVYLVRRVGVFGGRQAGGDGNGRGRVGSFKRRARFALGEREGGKGRENGKGDVESVSVSVVEVEGGSGRGVA